MQARCTKRDLVGGGGESVLELLICLTIPLAWGGGGEGKPGLIFPTGILMQGGWGGAAGVCAVGLLRAFSSLIPYSEENECVC